MTGRSSTPGAAVAWADVTPFRSRRVHSALVQTNELGDFPWQPQPGVYTVTVTSPGFKTLQRTNVVLASRKRWRWDGWAWRSAR